MEKFAKDYADKFMAGLIARNPGEPEFHQAVREVVDSVAEYICDYPHLMDEKILERMTEPERVIMFRVPWMDDRGEIHINRGFRVQMNCLILSGMQDLKDLEPSPIPRKRAPGERRT